MEPPPKSANSVSANAQTELVAWAEGLVAEYDTLYAIALSHACTELTARTRAELEFLSSQRVWARNLVKVCKQR